MNDLQLFQDMLRRAEVGFDLLDHEEPEVRLVVDDHENVGGYFDFSAAFVFSPDGTLDRVSVTEGDRR